MINYKKWLMVGLIILLVIGVIVVIAKKSPNLFNQVSNRFSTQLKTATTTISPDVLYLTNPVFSFSGTVESISGNTITLSRTATLQTNQMMMPALNAPGSPADNKTITKKLTYKVTVDAKTTINRPSNIINAPIPLAQPGSANQPAALPAAPASLTIKDIQVGEVVTVNSSTDLRTLQGNNITATTIMLAPKLMSLSGTISAIKGNILTISSYGTSMMPGEMPTAKEYSVTVADTTQITKRTMSADPAKMATPEKISLHQLSVGQQVNVTTDSEITTKTKAKALKIEVSAMVLPIMPPANLPAAASSPVSTQPASAKP